MQTPILLFTFAKKIFSQMNCVSKVMTEKSENMYLELKIETDLPFGECK